MAQRQEELERLVREQGARIAELERLLKERAPSASAPPVAVPAAASTSLATSPQDTPTDTKSTSGSGGPEYIPNAGFKLYESNKAQIYMRLFSYARYLNQKGLDPTYTDF